MTQGGEEGNRDSKILCCYYRMRSASTGLGNETLKEVGKETEIRQTSISRMGRPISTMPSYFFLIDGKR
jgi:hypothetical protein